MLTYNHMDVKKPLHLSLVKERFSKLKTTKKEDVESGIKQNEETLLYPNIYVMAYHVSSYLHDTLAEQAVSIEKKYLDNLQLLLNFEYDTLVHEMDPIVWNFFSNLTKN